MKTTACILLLLGLILSSCTKRPFTDEEFRSASYSTLDWLKNNHSAIHSNDANLLFQRVSQRLVNAIDTLPANYALPLTRVRKFQILLLNHDDPNAFSLGSGLIILTQGLFNVLDTEAELAAIIAHEMAHDLLAHHHDALEASLRRKSDSNSPTYNFSLEQELSADQLGLAILRYANYDLRYALAALSTVYRQTQRLVADETWWESRSALLHNEITYGEPFLPATVSTREFMRAKSNILTSDSQSSTQFIN